MVNTLCKDTLCKHHILTAATMSHCIPNKVDLQGLDNNKKKKNGILN